MSAGDAEVLLLCCILLLTCITGAGCALEKVNLSGGKYLTFGATFAPGNKDSPFRAPSTGLYGRRLRHAQNSHVIFFDVDSEHRRAWLFDGARALLHMTYARLQHEQNEYGTSFRFQFSEIKQPDHLYAADFALNVLENRDNMQLPVFKDTCTNYQSNLLVEEREFRFCHVVEILCDYLEKLLDLQNSMSNTIKVSPRDRIEGYDFHHVAIGKDPIRAHYHELKESGWGWVDFTRSLDTLVFFGRGFGDLLTPGQGANRLCSVWQCAPRGKDYLVARTSDLIILQKQWHKDSDVGPLRVGEKVYWHKPNLQFESCSCEKQTQKMGLLERATCDRVQTLFNSSFYGNKQVPNKPDEYPQGAVVFGQSNRIRLRFPKLGHLREMSASDAEDQPTAINNTDVYELDVTGSNASSPHLASRLSTPQTSRSLRSFFKQKIGRRANEKDPANSLQSSSPSRPAVSPAPD